MNYTSGLGGREMLGDGAIERIERHDPFQTTQDLEIGMSIIGRQSVDQGASKHTHSMTSSPRRHNNVPSPSPSPGNREIHANEDSKRLRPSAMPVAKKHTTQERKVASIEQHRAIQHRPTIRPGANTTRSPFDGQEYLHSRNRVDTGPTSARWLA